MRKQRRSLVTITVRLTDEEYKVLGRLCALKQTSQTGYLARLASRQAKQELLDYAVQEYVEGKASFSELAKKTGLDVPTIVDGVAKIRGEDKQAVDGFLAAVKTLAESNDDPEFYQLAVKALSELDLP